MDGFSVESIEDLVLECSSPLSYMYKLSPFVWRDRGRYEILIRAVNHSRYPAEKVARIYHGWSRDGLNFVMDDHPALAPGIGDDKDGCEDPTVAKSGALSYVYYTGWNETKKVGHLMLAVGPDMDHLEKTGIAIPSARGWTDTKEATVVALPDGTSRLFFEFASNGASKIGVAAARTLEGPWEILAPPFDARPDHWDGWHLSPGPILSSDPQHPVMFYNGATRKAAWRIGWIVFNANYTCIVDRCEEPIITPPEGGPGDSDIAFAASSIEEDGSIFLYYSVADKDMFRARLRRR